MLLSFIGCLDVLISALRDKVLHNLSKPFISSPVKQRSMIVIKFV